MSIIVSMQSYITKRTPKMVRGMVMATIGAMGCAGSVLYLQLSAWASKWQPFMIFGVIAILDFIVLVGLLIFIKMGKFGQPAYDMGDGSDEEAKSAQSARGADDGAGGYDDIPQLPEVYDERILEAEEDNEASTMREGTYKEDVMIKSSRSKENGRLVQGSIQQLSTSTLGLEEFEYKEQKRASAYSKNKRSSVVSIPYND